MESSRGNERRLKNAPYLLHYMKLFLLSVTLFASSLLAQTSAIVRGVVSDESGAVVPGAKITLTAAGGAAKTISSGIDGAYSFAGLAPGNYTLQAGAPDLSLPPLPRLVLRPGVLTLDLKLKVSATVQQVTVAEDTAPIVTPDPANNASAVILRGEDLQALADDPDDLAADLQALAGPAAGPNGGSIYIDGFSGGQLPSKESIREIRINQNPFSPEYDKLGFGRIEILTKPGSDKFHGTGFYNFAHDVWDSRNPYSATKAPFLLQEYGGNFGGPLNKRASFFVDVRRDAVDNGFVINAITLDPTTLGIVNPYSAILVAPQRRLSITPRIDYQLSTNNTLVVRYGYSAIDVRDAGVGAFNLAERGYHTSAPANTVQATETTILGANMVNEIRFQYFRINSEILANNSAPGIAVLGSFNGGGSTAGHTTTLQNSYEFQEVLSIARKAHSLRFGLRMRGQLDNDVSPQNFNGTFTFGGGTGPVLNAANQPVLDAAGNPVLAPISSIERYRRTLLFQKLGLPASQIRTLGGGATQFSINAGQPALSAGQVDAGLFAGDDWRVRPNITLSLGLRYEMQSNVSDWHDIAPRIGIAWAPSAGGSGKGRPKTVIRAGFGMFYDRFALNNTINAQRYNGLVQQQYISGNPDFFPVIPPLALLGGAQSTRSIQQISSTLRAPYIMQSALSVERQLPHGTTLAVTYANSHGLHVLRTRNINAPLPGTYSPDRPQSGVYPNGTPGAIFLTESAGLYNQHQLIVSVNSKLNANVSLFGNYLLNKAMSNTDGLGTSVANPYNYAGEYGPASTDIRNRMVVGGALATRWNIRVSPFLVIDSGPPFDITAGRDLYGTTLFNARPGIATDSTRPGLIQTSYGLLDPNPMAGERILPRNYGRGPGSIRFNMRIAKTFGFGAAKEGSTGGSPGQPGGGGQRPGGGNPFGGGGGGMFGGTPTSRRYSLIVSLQAQNVLNHTNPGPITGNITSPLFGQANQLAGGAGGGGFSENANNRRLELQLRFTF